MWDFFTGLWDGAVRIVEYGVEYVKLGAGAVRNSAEVGWNFTSGCAKAVWSSCKSTWPINKAKAILGGFLGFVGVAFIGIAAAALVLTATAIWFVGLPLVAWKLLMAGAYVVGAIVLVGVVLFIPIAIFFGGGYVMLNMKANPDMKAVFAQAECV